jgi:hypothetical protein
LGIGVKVLLWHTDPEPEILYVRALFDVATLLVGAPTRVAAVMRKLEELNFHIPD